ncbi:unnamed protein product [Didymodactylos carnosus]|uniref:RanBP2-type domain-containing protein n=1 Tax=Didymodactylos carnosus TaxID=1234261 RepID=A0A814BZT3_9BILA|nr:unnamed protein product [Didymodactylos carnosus]CAF1389249.1 unnamed protein product [Didymodactylos carnosus]CAF3710765.1 unnamed protein product [Didymodactylos carnosus]CAF4197013.1 unnamed protein product [Didymodactylos carnosus]
MDGFEILAANIYTSGQGICLQRLKPSKMCSKFEFDQSLWYGSWYDVQIIGRSKSEEADGLTDQRYLKKGIYLSGGKIVTITELTDEKYLDQENKWTCGSCNKDNSGSLALCEFCFINKAQKVINVLSYIPVLGLPFSRSKSFLRMRLEKNFFHAD